MPKLITVYWRDIPTQVIAQQGRSKFKQQLAPRFARAIDRAAMRAGRGSSEAYLSDWRRESAPCDGDLTRAVLEQVARLEAAFPDEILESVTRRGGKLQTHEEP
jgi:hypothetical protein